MKQAVGARAAICLTGTRPGLGTALAVLALLSIVTAWAGGVAAPRVWVLLVLAPLVEEAVFRAGLHEALLRRWNKPLMANLITALIFGLAHAAVRGDWAGLAVAAPALLIGAVYGRWRRLRLCVALHAALNALCLAWGWVGVSTILGT